MNPTHAHQLVMLPDDWDETRTIFGWAKRFATRAARNACDELRDKEIWAEGESIIPIRDEGHRINARDYILTKQGANAWTWSPEKGPKW